MHATSHNQDLEKFGRHLAYQSCKLNFPWVLSTTNPVHREQLTYKSSEVNFTPVSLDEIQSVLFYLEHLMPTGTIQHKEDS